MSVRFVRSIPTVITHVLLLPDGTAAAPALAFSANTNSGIYNTSGNVSVAVVGSEIVRVYGGGILIGSAGQFVWSSAAAPSTPELSLSRSAAGSLTIGGVGNGQKFGVKALTELVTLTSGNATPATVIQLPINAIIMGVSVRVTVQPATSATFTVTGTTSATAFQTGANVSTALDTTDVGTKSCPYLNTTAQTVTVTFNAAPTDSLGRIRVTIHYFDVTAATS